jgi:serine/threonine protein phosphatase PrpC
MAMAAQASTAGSGAKRPTDDELDYYGITHKGNVRTTNQDQFLVATIHPQIVVWDTSIPDVNSLPLRGTRLGTMMLVADGVGGGDDGGEAARLATEAVMRYVASSMRCYHTAGSANEEQFYTALKTAALQAHDAVRAEAASRSPGTRMATTLTLGIGVWPWMYVVQVGDSRCYLYTGGKLRQVTRDQTLAQQLADEGALDPAVVKKSPLNNVLTSAIGADEAVPVVTRVDVTNCVVFLCSDGLTKHVSDDEIAAHIANRRSAEQVCRDLLVLTLERGGTDNVTIVCCARARREGVA